MTIAQKVWDIDLRAVEQPDRRLHLCAAQEGRPRLRDAADPHRRRRRLPLRHQRGMKPTGRGSARSLRLKLTLWFLLSSRSALAAPGRDRLRPARPRAPHEPEPGRGRGSREHRQLQVGVDQPEWAGSRACCPTTCVRLLRRAQPGRRGADRLATRRGRARPLHQQRRRCPRARSGRRDQPDRLARRGARAGRGTRRDPDAALPRGGDYFLQVGVKEDEIEGVLRPFLDLSVLGVPLAVAALVAAWMISGARCSPSCGWRAPRASLAVAAGRAHPAPDDRRGIPGPAEELN